MPENIHDKGYKRILKTKKQFLSLLNDFVSAEWVKEINLDDLELIDGSFVPKDFREKESDILYKLNFKGENIIFYCLLELQSSVDYAMPYRLLGYMMEVFNREFKDTDENYRNTKEFKLPAIIPIVLYNGSDEWTAVRNFREYLHGSKYFKEELIDFKYILLNINKYDDDSLFEIGTLISSIFVLDKKQKREDFAIKFNKTLRVLANLSDGEKIEFWDWIEDVFFKKATSEVKKVAKVIKEKFSKGVNEDMTYALERFVDEIREEGLEAGLEKGLEEGKIEMALNGFKNGFDIDAIQKFTNLDIDFLYIISGVKGEVLLEDALKLYHEYLEKKNI